MKKKKVKQDKVKKFFHSLKDFFVKFRVLIFTILIVVTACVVFLVVKGLKHEELEEGAWAELARLKKEKNSKLEEFEVAEKKYKNTEAYPLILYYYAEKLLKEKKFEKCKAVLERIMQEFPEHSIIESDSPQKLLQAVEEELKWKKKYPEDFEKVEEKFLPEVSITIKKNKNLTLELFEDDAPEIVNHFVYLVEKDHLKNLKFIKVESYTIGKKKKKKKDKKKNSNKVKKKKKKDKKKLDVKKKKEEEKKYPYLLHCDIPKEDKKDLEEFELNAKKNDRKHLVGSLSLVRDKKNSKNTHFIICIKAMPKFDKDENYIVFGRVKSWTGHLDTIKEGDKIIKIKVSKKRDHSYKPPTNEK